MAKYCDSFSVDIDFDRISENRYEHPVTKYLYIKDSVVASEGVFERPYNQVKLSLSEEDMQKVRLSDKDKVNFFISEETLKQSTKSFACTQLLFEHHMPDIYDPKKSKEIGHTGSGYYMSDGEMICDLMVIKDRKIKEDIKSKKLQGLSIGYNGEMIYNPGDYNGKSYLFEMVNIQGSHVAADNNHRNKKAKFADSTTGDFLTNEDFNMDEQKIQLSAKMLDFFSSIFGKSETVAYTDSTTNDTANTEAATQEAATSEQVNNETVNESQPEQVSNEPKSFVLDDDSSKKILMALKQYTDESLETIKSGIDAKIQDAVAAIATAKATVDTKTKELAEYASKLLSPKYAQSVAFGDGLSFDQKVDTILEQLNVPQSIKEKSTERKLQFLEDASIARMTPSKKVQYGDSTTNDKTPSASSTNDLNLF